MGRGGGKVRGFISQRKKNKHTSQPGLHHKDAGPLHFQSRALPAGLGPGLGEQPLATFRARSVLCDGEAGQWLQCNGTVYDGSHC